MNEQIKAPDVDDETVTGFRPRWWRLSPEDEGCDEIQIVDSLSLFSMRLKGYGRLLGDSDKLDHETVVEAGDMLADLAYEMEAFAELVDARREARVEAAMATESKPDAMDALRESVTFGERILEWTRTNRAETARQRHAAVIAEIEAGTRDESDREEADRILAAALAPPVLAEDEASDAGVPA